MRTLVVSDLHLGTRIERDVLRHDAAVDALLAGLEGVDRLVLLGDVIELAEARASQAVLVAEPVLRAIGGRLGPGGEVLLLPGNHDAALVRPWLRRHGVPAAVDATIPDNATPLLAQMVSWLAPADVRVHYPGAWLSDRIYATHGHYLDRHLLPDSAYGLARGRLDRHPEDRATVGDYEHPRRPSARRAEGRLSRLLPRPVAALADDVAEFLRASTMPDAARRRGGRHLAPITARLLGTQMQRASIPALARVVHRLDIDADIVVFGHVHRRGPLPEDDAALWAGPGGRPRVVNTGSWTYERLLLHGAGPPHPYWPGGAIVIDDDGEPRSIGLLDGLDAAALGG